MISPNEFKAWFIGFCDNLDGPPCATQFEHIKKMVAFMDASAGAHGVQNFQHPRYLPDMFNRPPGDCGCKKRHPDLVAPAEGGEDE